MVNEQTRTYTLILRPEGPVNESLLGEIGEALATIDGVVVGQIESLPALGLDRRELYISAALSFVVTVGANLTSGAIQKALEGNERTGGVTVEELVPEEVDERPEKTVPDATSPTAPAADDG